MIKLFSQRIAKIMGAQLQVDRDRVEIFAYGLEIILGTLVQLVMMLLLSLILDTFITTIICMIAFASLRHSGGGIHLSTYLRCLAMGVALILGLGKLATMDVSVEILTIILILVLLMGIYTIFNWAPAGTEKKQIKDMSIKLRQRKKAFFILTVWSVITFTLIKYGFTSFAFAVILGLFSSLFLITPWGYRTAQAFDNILNTTGRRC